MNSTLPAANASASRDNPAPPLPLDWSTGTIGETCERPEYGYTASAQKELVGPKFLRITDIQDGGVDWKTVPHCRCEEGIVYRLGLRRGDLLIARIGGTTGKSFLVRNCPETIFASYLIRLRSKAVDPEFLYFFCQSDLYWRQILASKGEKLKGGISGSTLGGIVHPLPPPAEQRAIAGVLSKLQASVEVQDRIVATLKELKAATMAKLFREGLRGEPLKQTEIGELPLSWEVVRFGNFATLKRGFDLPVQVRTAGPFPVIGSNGIVGTHNEAMAKGPGVATGRSGTIGRSSYSASDFWPLNTSLFVTDFHGNNPLFVLYFFEQFDFEKYAAGVSVPTLNRNLVHEASIGIPAVDEQNRIAITLSKLEESEETAKQRRTSRALLFASMLSQLVSGRLRVNERAVG